MNAKPFLFGGLAFLLIRGFQKAAAIQRFVYDIAGLPTVRTEGSRVVFTFQLVVTNKSPELFNVTQIFSRILVNGSYIGDVAVTQPFTITGSASITIPLTLSLEATNTILALVSAVSGGTGGLVVKFDGYVQSSSLTIPISFDKKLR